MKKAVALVPTAIGAVGGVYLLLFPATWKLVALTGIALVLLVLLVVARKCFARSPERWRVAIEFWIGFLPIVTALAVWLLLWITVKAEPGSVLPLPGWDPKQKADLVKYLAGIVTGLAAALVSEEPEKNWFWPACQFFHAAKPLTPASEEENPERYHAASMPCTLGNVNCGWGFKARGARAAILGKPPPPLPPAPPPEKAA